MAGSESGFAFDEITFDKVGEYVYTVVEKSTGKGGVTYDQTSFVAKVNNEKKYLINKNIRGIIFPECFYFRKDLNCNVFVL